jgi:hypothetical protein
MKGAENIEVMEIAEITTMNILKNAKIMEIITVMMIVANSKNMKVACTAHMIVIIVED